MRKQDTYAMIKMMDRKSSKLVRKTKRSVSSSSSTSVSSSRGRRGALGAFHFKQEKVMKQVLNLAKEGKVAELRKVLDGIEVEDIDGGTEALVAAATCGHMETVAVLLRFGAYVNKCGEVDCAAIHLAAKKGHCAVISLLLSHGANVDMVNKSDKRTALHMVALLGLIEVAKMLLENNAKVDARDIYGMTPLHLAARMGQNTMAEILLAHKADVDSYDNDGWTSLHLAAETGNIAMVKLLLQHNAQTDCRNKYGRTPLHWAATNGHGLIVAELLRNKADPNIKDLNQKTPLQYAMTPAIKQLLKPLTLSTSCQQGTVSSIGLLVHLGPRLPSVTEEAEDKTSPLEVCVDGHTNAESSEISSPGSASTTTSTTSKQDQMEDSIQSSGSFSIHRMFKELDSESQTSSPQSPASPLRDKPSDKTCVQLGPIITSPVKKGKKITSRNETETHTNQTSLSETFETIIKSLTSIMTDVQDVSRDLGKSRDTMRAEVMSSCMKETQTRLYKLNGVMSHIQDDVRGAADVIHHYNNNNMCSHCIHNPPYHPLPMVFYQGMFYAVGVRVSSHPDGWRTLVQALRLPAVESEQVIKDIKAECGKDDLRSTLRAVLYASSVVSDQISTALKDLLWFLDRCQLEDGIKVALVGDLVQHITPENPDLDTLTLQKLSGLLSQQVEQLAVNLGVSHDELNELRNSTQNPCLGVLTRWRANTEGDEKLTLLAEALIDIGREDLLTVLLSMDS